MGALLGLESPARWLLGSLPTADSGRIVDNCDYFVNGPQAGSLIFDIFVLRL